jgi:predicted lipase
VIDQVDVWVDGSNDLVDWIYNFRTMRSIGDNERVNRMDRHEAIRVLRVLLRTYPNTQKWYINGHSRGGAIAQIVARELARKGHRVLLRCVGSKRTGNRRFVQALSGVVRTLSVRNRGDLVPFLPPWYARLQPEIVTYKPWSGPYKAHVDYDGWR